MDIDVIQMDTISEDSDSIPRPVINPASKGKLMSKVTPPFEIKKKHGEVLPDLLVTMGWSVKPRPRSGWFGFGG